MRFLLDTNVLIALIDPAHVHHERAHEWFAAKGKHAWATCPITQNGLLRIVGHPRYPSSPGPPPVLAKLLARFVGLPGHEFWPDNITMLDQTRVREDRLLDSARITDSYLVALAAAHRGQFATFDQRLVADAVIDGAKALHVIR